MNLWDKVRVLPNGAWVSDSVIPHWCSPPLLNWVAEFFPKDELLLDFGCGPGEYLRQLEQRGFTRLQGYEYRRTSDSWHGVIEQDLTQPFTVPEPGNILCVEVGEHIPAELEQVFIENLSRNCRGHLVLTWGVRGQDFLGHVNCLNNEEVIPKVESHGFEFLPEETALAKAGITDDRKSVMVYRKVG